MQENKQLNEINIIRPIAIILLIFMHSFSMYDNYDSNVANIYHWIVKIFTSCRLEILTFISGYLFSFSIYEKKKNLYIREVIRSKFKRLIIPSIVFSICYLYLFLPSEKNITVYHVLSGIAHMWFLPMLFWNFIASFFLMKLKIPEYIKLILLSLLAIVSFIPLPFHMTQSMYYMLFFYLGIYIYANKQYFIDNFATNKRCILLCFIFLLLIIPMTLIKYDTFAYLGYENANIYKKVSVLMIVNFARVILATTGLILFYSLALLYLKQRPKISFVWRSTTGLCMGAYLFHQFILKYMYYNTSLPLQLGYLLPWVAFLITTMLSFALAYIFRKFKFGKFLIG